MLFSNVWKDQETRQAAAARAAKNQTLSMMM
jgi:hypothetical protein